MLQKFHDKIKGWVASAIIAILCLAFALWGVQYYVGGDSGSGKALVKIGDKKITVSELEMLYRQMQQRAVDKGMHLDDGVNAQLKAQALNQLMLVTLLSEAAKQEGFVVAHQQVEQVVMSIPNFQDQGQFSPKLFQEYLMNAGLTQQGYFHELQNEMLINQVSNSIEGSAFVLPPEVAAFYDLMREMRSFGYLMIAAHQFIPQIKVSDKEVEQYYANNKDKFREPEKLRIEYLQLSPQKIAQSIQLNPLEVKQYYQDHLANYRVPASWKVETITVPVSSDASSKQIGAARNKMQKIIQLLKKSSFTDILKQYQGKTQTLYEGEVPENLQSALKSLKVGQTSPPINTNEGYLIVHLLAHTAEKTKSFAEVESQLKEMLTQQKTERKLADLNEKLSNLTYTNPNTLEPAAKALGVVLQVSEPFSAEGAKAGIAANPEIVRVAFSKEVMQQGDNSNPITLKDGSVVVLRLKQRIAAKLQPLSTVAPKVRVELLGQLADAKAVVLANQLETEMNQGKNPAQLAAQHHLTWKQEQDIQRTNIKLSPALVKAVFDQSAADGAKATTVTLSNGDIAVMVLQKITRPDFAKASDREKQQVARELQETLAQLNYRLYVQNAKFTIKTKAYEQNLKALEGDL